MHAQLVISGFRGKILVGYPVLQSEGQTNVTVAEISRFPDAPLVGVPGSLDTMSIRCM